MNGDDVGRRTAALSAEQCIGGRDLTEPRLSPDGRMLGLAQSAAGVAALELHRFDGEPPRLLTTHPAPRPGRGLGGGCWCWTPDSAAVVYCSADGNLWLQPVPGGAVRRLTDHGPERVAQAPMVSPDGTVVVYAVDQSEVWEAPITGGPPRRLDDGSDDFCFDPWIDGRTVRWHAWSVPAMPWDRSVVRTVDRATGERGTVTPAGSVQQPRTMADGRPLHVCDDTGFANVWLDGRPLVDEPWEHAGPVWGMGQRSFAASPDETRVAFTRNVAGFGQLCLADVATGAVRVLARGVHGQLSWAGNLLAAIRTGARTPTQVVVYDMEPVAGDDATPRRDVVAVGPVSGWDAVELAEPELVEVPVPHLPCGSSATVHGRMYRAGAAGGAAVGPPRLIVWLHGGPTDQWQVTFMPRIAYWTSRGWNVLVVDHRGSSGHGREYQQAMRGRWGELDVADTVAVTRAAHAAGDGTPATTVLMGGSAGGFTVLGAAAAAPELYAAAVATYPVTDLVSLAEHSHRFERHYTDTLVGSFDDPAIRRVALARSPVAFADRIRVPLLVLHGDADPVVPVSQSRVLAERMRAVGNEVELRVYENEGHGFRTAENRLDEYARVEAFLDRHVVAARERPSAG